MPKSTKPRSVKAADIAIGKRIHQRRIEQKVSQETLGDKIGVSFQQVQKYEKGVNRVGAGRLMQIAKALDCEIGFFLPDAAHRPNADSVLDNFMTSKDGVMIARAFERIDVNMRHMIARFVDGLSRSGGILMEPAE
jgi:transcriptional regulator with XRE-family HTH domain